MSISDKKERIKVLFVDNDVKFLKRAKECLQIQNEFDIESASSIKEALAKIKHEKTDAIVCDCEMPVTDGFEFLKALRDGGNRVPFIVFTVTEDKEKAIKAFSLGANGFIGKYGDPEVVFNTLKRCIEQSLNKK
jgi:DNA-binding NtrC family response regulator